MSLASAEQLLVKVRTGHVALLGRYGIATKDATGKTISEGAAIAKLSAMYAGSAKTATESLTGKTKVLHAEFTDMTAHLGQKLIPILITLGNDVENVVGFFERTAWRRSFSLSLPALWALRSRPLFILDKVTRLMSYFTKATEAEDAAMDANPITLVVAALAALAAGIYIAYEKVGWFHKAVDDAWQILQTGYDWVKKNWPLLLGILTGPFGLAVWTISHYRDDIFGFISSIPRHIGGAFSDVESLISAPFKWAFKKIIEVWDDTAGALFHGQSIGIPHVATVTLPDLRIPVPSFHSGGTFFAGGRSIRRSRLAAVW